MEWGITFLSELKKMKEQMDRTWKDLIEETPGDKEEAWQWAERFPKFEGPGRRGTRSRAGTTIK